MASNSYRRFSPRTILVSRLGNMKNTPLVSRTIRVVLTIMSFAPAATYSVVAAVLYDLDQDFAGGLFVTNVVAFLFLVLPVLAFLI